MRIWGRVAGVWTEVSTQPNGNNDNVYITNLIQALRLNLGESPFNADYGIPAEQSVITQVFPDFYMNLMQQQFAQFFAVLIIESITSLDARGVPQPSYRINITTHSGTTIEQVIPQ